MASFIERRIAARPGGAAAQASAGLLWALIAVGARWLLNPLLGDTTPFILFFPAVMAASVFSGGIAGAVCLAASCLAGAVLFVAPHGLFAEGKRGVLLVVVFLASGSTLLWLIQLLKRAMTALEAARAQERLLMAELQHRVKNTLAIVQGIAAQTLKVDEDPGRARDVFNHRLAALSEAHDLVSASGWGRVSMRHILGRTLEPFGGAHGERIVLDGDEVSLPSDDVIGLVLCVHELATNATKHGALSVDPGRVDVRWRLDQGDGIRRIALEWLENGGPPVLPPSRKGFGSRLLRHGLSPRTRPEVAMDFAPTGVCWRASFDAL